MDTKLNVNIRNFVLFQRKIPLIRYVKVRLALNLKQQLFKMNVFEDHGDKERYGNHGKTSKRAFLE